MTLSFNDQGMTTSLADLQDVLPGLVSAFGFLRDKGWHCRKVTSTIEYASLWDLLILAVWSKHNPTKYGLWQKLFWWLFPKLIFAAGSLVDRMACQRASLQAQALPLLKSKHGNTRRIPKINKLLLLQKMKDQSRHRQESMKTHHDLCSASSTLVKHEMLLVVNQWLLQLEFFGFGSCTALLFLLS